MKNGTLFFSQERYTFSILVRLNEVAREKSPKNRSRPHRNVKKRERMNCNENRWNE